MFHVITPEFYENPMMELSFLDSAEQFSEKYSTFLFTEVVPTNLRIQSAPSGVITFELSVSFSSIEIKVESNDPNNGPDSYKWEIPQI